MKKTGFLLGTLALLMVGCSTTPTPAPTVNSPTVSTPGSNSSESGAAETTATPEQVSAATNTLESLALTATTSGPVTAQVRTDGTLLVNSQPMFPMGFYHVSWAGNEARRMRDMNAIADLGFNTMNATMFDPEGDLEGYRKLLDAAQSRGMKLMVEDFNSTSINTLKSHPAVLGWMIADDCNNLITPEELLRRHDAVKTLDSNHLTYTSMAISFANSHSAYFGRADAVGNQSYPIDGGDPVNVVYPVMKQLVRESSAKGTLPIANLQAFHWKNGRYPTPRELNSMTNQALGAGVKGILYYTYLDTTNDLASYKGLNTELKALAGEVKLLAPVLMNGQRTPLTVTTANNQGVAHLWSYQNRRYLQVINMNPTKGQTVKVQLPNSATKLLPLFAGRPTGLKLSGSTVSGSMTTLAVHWYEVQ
ncbi:hypothetical protein [Deinococcus fonticola]|uniref:hypothetical protein n=1 Tax=Deinococcus fonticola TaxID=2528713 RepID=UPI001074F401|nr:hypothetical protein [Deinococcus fonticola]